MAIGAAWKGSHHAAPHLLLPLGVNTSANPPQSTEALLNQAESLWHAARYRDSLELLNSMEWSARRCLLAAKASYGLRQFEDALAHLRAGELYFVSPDDRVDADSLSALLHAFCGHHREAQAFLDRHGSASLHRVRRPIAVEAHYRAGLCAWMRDDIQKVERCAREIERFDHEARFYGEILRSWVLSSRDMLREQTRALAQVLLGLRNSLNSNVGLVSNLLQTASSRCREIKDLQAFQIVCDLESSIGWTEDLQLVHFQTLRNLGWAHAMRGDYIVGIRKLNRAKDIAPSSFWRVMSMLDHAWMGLASGDSATAVAELLDADDVLKAMQWNGLTGEEPMALLVASDLFSEFDVGRASSHLAAYESLNGAISCGHDLRHGKRLRAMELFCRGKVMHRAGDVARARPYLKASYEIFARIGFDWRAARCALLLYCGGAGEVWLQRAQASTASFPRSFVAAELAQHCSDTESVKLSRLTPRQREVLALLREGATVREVATRLNASPNTIRVHITKIHQALGVRSRAQLLAAQRE